MTSLDQSAFEADVGVGNFLNGSLSTRWGMHDIVWPHVWIWVRARDGTQWFFRFELTNYPRTAPTATPWDMEKNVPLETARWPKGGTRIAAAFNPSWNPIALYLPCDRAAMSGHENWRHEHPALWWDPAVGLYRYVQAIYDLLNSGDYTNAT